MSPKNSHTEMLEFTAFKGRIHGKLTNVLDKLYETPSWIAEMYLPLEKDRAACLVRRLVYRAIDEEKDALKAGKEVLKDGIASFELKSSLPYGTLLKIFEVLPLSPKARATAIRNANRLAELPKGWLGFRKGGPQRKITVSDYRHDSKLRAVLASGLIYKDMELCGSEAAFRSQFCPTLRKETPEAKCLRSLGHVERWSEDLDATGRKRVRERLGDLCTLFGLLVNESEDGVSDGKISQKYSQPGRTSMAAVKKEDPRGSASRNTNSSDCKQSNSGFGSGSVKSTHKKARNGEH